MSLTQAASTFDRLHFRTASLPASEWRTSAGAASGMRSGIFRNEEVTASAQGHFVHAYVDRGTNRPTLTLPERLREALQTLVIDNARGLNISTKKGPSAEIGIVADRLDRSGRRPSRYPGSSNH